MKQDISQSIAACAAHYGEDADAMRDYLVEGERNAYLINNRGEIRFDDNGDLAQDILDAYSKYGFYVFEGVLAEDELDDIKTDLHAKHVQRLQEEWGMDTCSAVSTPYVKPILQSLTVNSRKTVSRL